MTSSPLTPTAEIQSRAAGGLPPIQRVIKTPKRTQAATWQMISDLVRFGTVT
jgi:hypothetical protein